MTTTLAQPAKVASDQIVIEGASEHNLKHIDVCIPREKLTVITGVSGSGKSSLAFDTIYAEGQRRYMESFSAYARQFIGNMERPDVERISGLSPVISIEQKTVSKNPRSTVGTITEIYDFLRLLFARAGKAYSYVTGKPMVQFTQSQIASHILHHYKGCKIILLAPMVRARKGHYRELFEQIRRQGFVKVQVDGEMMELEPGMKVDRYKIHDIEVVVDRFQITDDARQRLEASLALGLRIGDDAVLIKDHETDEEKTYSKKLMCPDSGIAYEKPAPNAFSFNSPYGACPACNGLGSVYRVNRESVIPDPGKSIAEGGIVPLGNKTSTVRYRQVKAIADKFDFKLTTPIRKIPQKALKMILAGSEGKSLEVYMDNGSGSGVYYDLTFEGIIPILEWYHRESHSRKIRRWARQFMRKHTCPKCVGTRLKQESLYFKLAGKHIGELAQMELRTLHAWFEDVEERLDRRQQTIARDVLKEIRDRLGFLLQVGLDYLSLNLPARTLSGGESQRIRLATQIGSKLTGVLYILDEPTIGLHQHDNHRLIRALRQLVALHNTVIVVEHDQAIMEAADYIIDLGPGAGKNGGYLTGSGTLADFLKSDTRTARYLRGAERIDVPARRRKGTHRLILKGATGHNLKQVDAYFPLGTMICVTGVSGSGKSSLVNQTLYPALHQACYPNAVSEPLPYKEIDGLQYIDKVIEIDQSPIGRTPRSAPATYIGVFTEIRQLFARLPEAQVRGYSPSRFSFNVKGGRCETCRGNGMRLIEMQFLPDVQVPCEDCLGKRYNRETLEIRYKGKSISDVLSMTVRESARFFENVPAIYQKLKTLEAVGLRYITLGQSSTTLSGGEAQRVKLSAELVKKATGNTFYILDEPTTGLHFRDIKVLLDVLEQLVEKGNTVVVIEHNPDVIKVADHIIDLGPGGGKKGGRIIATGTPEQMAQNKHSYTGQYLKEALR